VGSGVIMLKKYQLPWHSPTNAIGSCFQLLESLRVNLGVDFRTCRYVPQVNGASVFPDGVARVFQQQKEPLFFFLSERIWMTILMAFHSQVLMIRSTLVTCNSAVEKIITFDPV
jgi:hypothetical protein